MKLSRPSLLRTLSITLAALTQPSTSHFLLQSPPALGFDSSNSLRGPCGGYSFPSTTQSTTTTLPSFYAGGSAVSVQTLHPQSSFLIRGTLDKALAGNWTDLWPVVTEYGLNQFCWLGVGVPAAWVGRTGVVQVIQSGVDGVQYQCAAVAFTAGPQPTRPEVCTNSTGNSASFSSDPNLPSDGAAGAAAAPSGISSGTAAATSAVATVAPSASASASATATKASGGGLKVDTGNVMGFLGLVAFVAAMV